jgi:hypothetical protein
MAEKSQESYNKPTSETCEFDRSLENLTVEVGIRARKQVTGVRLVVRSLSHPGPSLLM